MRRLNVVLGHVAPSEHSPAAGVSEVPLVNRAEELGPAFARLRETFLSGKTRKYGWRRQQLAALHAALVQHKDELVAAVMKDFHKQHRFENTVTLSLATAEVAELLKHFREWAQPQNVRSSLAQWPSTSQVRHEPK
jgi:aldehyde dehydrogenase (NAD+)